MKYIPAIILALATVIGGIAGSAWFLWTTPHGPFFMTLIMQILFVVIAVCAGTIVLSLAVFITNIITDEQTKELDK